jgi:flagellar hook assembly protein FlgD
LGEAVVTLVDKYQKSGEYQLIWNGHDAEGKPVGSGVYFYQIITGQFQETRKMSLIR